MSETVETFNVKNTSLRLVHLGSIMIPPDKVVSVVNDPMGINKANVESSEYLEETEEDANWNLSEETVKVEPVKKPTKAATSAKSATGAGWAKA